MIERFTDLAANERTFLAWVRTAITIIAFGFLVEKFELFLHYLAARSSSVAKPPAQVTAAETVGLLLMGLGIGMIAVAAFRFMAIRRRIQADISTNSMPAAVNVLLTVLLIFLLSFLIVYFIHAFVKIFS